MATKIKKYLWNFITNLTDLKLYFRADSWAPVLAVQWTLKLNIKYISIPGDKT